MPASTTAKQKISPYSRASFPGRERVNMVQHAIVLLSIRDSPKSTAHFFRATLCACLRDKVNDWLLLLGDRLHWHNLKTQFLAAADAGEDHLRQFLHSVDEAENEERLQWLQAIYKDCYTSNDKIAKSVDQVLIGKFEAWLKDRADHLGDMWVEENQATLYIAIRYSGCDLVYDDWSHFPAPQKISYIHTLYSEGKLTFRIEKWRDWENRPSLYDAGKKAEYDKAYQNFNAEYQKKTGLYQAIESDGANHLRHRHKGALRKWRTPDYLSAECFGLNWIAYLGDFQEIAYPSKILASLDLARQMLPEPKKLLWTKIKHSEARAKDPVYELDGLDISDSSIQCAIEYQPPSALTRPIMAGIHMAVNLQSGTSSPLLVAFLLALRVVATSLGRQGVSVDIDKAAQQDPAISYFFEQAPEFAQALGEGALTSAGFSAVTKNAK